MEFTNDEKIKVTIRTGTSTRPPILRRNPRVNNRFNSDSTNNRPMNNRSNNLYYDITYDELDPLRGLVHLMLISGRSNLPDILHRSLIDDQEMKRNDNIILNLEPRYSTISDKNTQCTVCMDNIDLNQTIVQTQCNHIFHSKCLDNWVKYKSDCPICRKKIPVLEK